MYFNVEAKIDADEIIHDLVYHHSEDDVLEFILDVDNLVGDFDFSKKLVLKLMETLAPCFEESELDDFISEIRLAAEDDD